MQRHKAFFGSLAENTYQSALKVQIGQTQIAQFRHPQASGIEQFEYAAVALAAPVTQIGPCQQGFHFIPAQYFGQVLGQFWIVQQLRRIIFYGVFLYGKIKKSPQC